MKFFTTLVMLLFAMPAHATVQAPVKPTFNTNMTTEPVSAEISVAEQKVRSAAVKVVSSRGGHGSGSLIKYKGLTLLLTANHVADGVLGTTYYAMKDGETKRGILVYGNPLHDISIIYMIEEFARVVPLKYSPRHDLIGVGEEITYSGFPSAHKLMTFRGRVAGYELLNDAGIQILLHTHGWFGCSGSVIYDTEGQVVGILWGIDVEHRPNLQVIGNLMWVQPIQAFNIDHALEALCRSGQIKSRACR